MIIKEPTIDDYPQVSSLLAKAFAPSAYESLLVRGLRENGKIAADYIIEENGNITAYICYLTAYNFCREEIGYHLAPVAVRPEKQRKGLGQRIIRKTLRELGGTRHIYVLGDPKYYSRFGLKADNHKDAFSIHLENTLW